jgi:hypothetical protein
VSTTSGVPAISASSAKPSSNGATAMQKRSFDAMNAAQSATTFGCRSAACSTSISASRRPAESAATSVRPG